MVLGSRHSRIWYVLNGIASTASPNVLYNSVPNPPNSCIVTCAINPPLYINYGESKSIAFSISINNSFEWKENSTPGYFEPFNGDTVFDIGIRGIKIL